MEELHQIAKAYYKACPAKIRQMADDFFKAMDCDGDGKVTPDEYLAFMKTVKCHPEKMNNRAFFDKLKTDGGRSGSLYEGQVRTLFYIINSARPFCGWCESFVTGVYFTCGKCFDDASTSYNLCLACFQKCKYDHEHRHDQFLDNFALLEAKRPVAADQKNKQLVASKKSQASTSTSVTGTMPPKSSKSLQLVPYVPPPPKQSKMDRAFKAADVVIRVASIIANCSVM